MIRSAALGLGALMLLAACDGKAPPPAAETPAAPTAPVANANDQAGASGPAEATEDFSQAVGRFNPASNRFIWVLPPGVHGKPPWTMNITVRHKGEVKYEGRIPLAPEIVPAGTYPDFPAGSEAVRLRDGGTWAAEMDKVGKVVSDLIARFGRGNGELVMETELNTALDDTGKQLYCVEKKDPVVQVYFEETSPAPKLTRMEMGPVAVFFRKRVLQDCPK